jgi:heme-degrading monooxygenase HmoA
MHALVFRVTIHERTEADRLLHEQMIPGVSSAPGFVAGYWVSTDEGKGTSVIVFESEDAVRRVAESSPRYETDAFTVDSVEIGKVDAHA